MMKGTKNPMMNAANVGSANSAHHRRIALPAMLIITFLLLESATLHCIVRRARSSTQFQPVKQNTRSRIPPIKPKLHGKHSTTICQTLSFTAFLHATTSHQSNYLSLHKIAKFQRFCIIIDYLQTFVIQSLSLRKLPNHHVHWSQLCPLRVMSCEMDVTVFLLEDYRRILEYSQPLHS